MIHYFKTPDTDWYRQRLTLSMFFVMGTFMLLISRLFWLQIVEGPEYRRLSENNCIRLQTLAPDRGIICDRNGTLLADNRPSFDLSIVPRDAAPLSETLEKLSRITGIPEEEMTAKIQHSRKMPGYRPLRLKDDITRDMLALIEAARFDLPGVVVDFKPRRQYPARTAAHVIGYLGEISPEELRSGRWPQVQGGYFVGRYGIERTQGIFLGGQPGGRQVEVDARGQVVRVLKTVDPVPGHSVWLTLDARLQHTAETLMEGKVGAFVAIEPDTGKIVAMVSLPSFDQNAFIRGISHAEWNALVGNPDRPLENKAVQAEYPPASTYKIVTALAGLEEGIIDGSTTFFCPGYYRFGDRVFRCWHQSGHGTVNVTQALAVSCDVFFYQVGLRLGVDRLAHYAHACGLGAPTGIELGHEASGLVPTSGWKKKKTGQSWQKGENLSIAIGQGYNLTTPLQLTMLTAAVANGGTLLRPSLVEKIVSVSGETVRSFEKQVIGRLPARPEHLALVRKGLWDVVNSPRGTARVARAQGIEISGKTGTAQVISRKKGDLSRKKIFAARHRPHAWFAGYGKKDEKQIAVAVIVEHGEHGGGTASPLVRDFIQAYFAAPARSEPEPEKTGGR